METQTDLFAVLIGILVAYGAGLVTALILTDGNVRILSLEATQARVETVQALKAKMAAEAELKRAEATFERQRDSMIHCLKQLTAALDPPKIVHQRAARSAAVQIGGNAINSVQEVA
jgi:hypothetical protein